MLLKGLSGHGKSNLVHALAFALDYSDKASTVAKTANYDGLFSVEATVESERSKIVSERGDNVKVNINGKEVLGSVPNKKAALAEEFGLGASVLRALSYRPQRTFGLFLSMPDDEKKNFLSELLGLKVVQDAFERTATAISKLETEIAKIRIDIEVAEKVIASSRTVMDFDPKALLDAAYQVLVTSTNVAALEGELAAKQDAYDSERRLIEGGINTILSQANQEIKVLESQKDFASPVPDSLTAVTEKFVKVVVARNKIEAEDKAARAKSDAETAKIRAALADVRKYENKLAALESRKELLERQLNETRLAADVCPTCKRQWGESGHHAKLVESAQNALAVLETEINGVKAYVGALPELEERLKAAAYVQDPRLERIKELYAQIEAEKRVEEEAHAAVKDRAYTEHMTQIANLKNSWLASIEKAKKNGAERLAELAIQLDLQGKAAKVKEFKDYLAVKRTELSNLKALEAKHQQMSAYVAANQAIIAKNDGCIKELGESLALEQAVASVLHKDGFVAYYFEQILQEITQETNGILQHVPNCRDITIFFGDKALKSGRTSKNIACNVRINGQELPYKELSGGQTSAVELAVDLAVRKVVARRTGTNIGWLVLDESFDGLGRADKEACLEVLKVVSSDTLVIVIDHSTEFQDMFTQTIEIRMENGISRIC
jgi:exonuclease SbcC